MSEGRCLTVAICTWNRASSLRRTLEAMLSLQRPSGWTWELVVVDNGSTDDTAQVVTDFENRLPVSYVLEPKLGLSNARNRAVNEAAGECVLWTDDDVLVPDQWLVAYTDALDSFPEAAFFGAAIEPHFEEPPPDWVHEVWPMVAALFSTRDPPPGAAKIALDYMPFGANYAIRSGAQRRHRYDPALGRRGLGLEGGEEWTVLRCLLSEGEQGRWVPGAGVMHMIPGERVTLERVGEILRAAPGLGRQILRAEARELASGFQLGGPRIAGRPVGLWIRWIISEVRFRLARAFGRAEVWMPLLVRSRSMRGFLDERR